MAYLEKCKYLEDGHEWVKKDENLLSGGSFIPQSLPFGMERDVDYTRRDIMSEVCDAISFNLN